MASGPPGRLRGELTEFVGRPAEFALVRRELRRGSPIRYVQLIDVPDYQRCLCLFEAAGPEMVRNVNDTAQFPLARVVAVLSSVPDGSIEERGPDDQR